MKPDRIDFLLEQLVLDTPPGPVSAECLGINRLLAILDSPEQIAPAELEHVTRCPACQRALRLARRERELIEAPPADEEVGTGPARGSDARGKGERRSPAPRTIKLPPWLGRRPVAAGIAAAVVIAVGVGLWSHYGHARPQAPALLETISGRIETGVTRGDERPERRYVVTIDLTMDAHITFIYLDYRGKLQLPRDVEATARRYTAGQRVAYGVTVTDDPPGPQWLAAVASRKEFNPFELLAKLQSAIADLPTGTPIPELVARLESRLRKLDGFEFRGMTFEVPKN